MALQQLVLMKKIKHERSKLDELLETRSKLNKRSKQIEKAFEELEDGDEENLKLLEEEVNELEEETKENDTHLEELEKTIKELEEEAEKYEDDEEEIIEPTPEPKETPKPQERSRGGDKMHIRERVQLTEVREFYEKVRDVIENKRGIEGGELTIPTQVIDAIIPRIREFSKYYDKVDVMRLTGNARVVVPGATPTGIWLECCDPLEELQLSVNVIDLDCYKVGGYVAVCNAMLDDSFVALAQFVEREIAKSIGKAIDEKFILGKKGDKSITGLAESDLPVVKTSFKLPELMTALAQAEDNDEFLDNSYTDERYLIVNSEDYYTNIAGQLLIPQVDGKYLIEAYKSKILPDGTKVIVDKNVPKGKGFYGDLKGYKLGERKAITLQRSEHAQFIQDNTVFKGVGRYDGKVAAPTIVELSFEGDAGLGE